MYSQGYGIMVLDSGRYRYRGVARLPELFAGFREQPNYVFVKDLEEKQLDVGRFLLDGNPPNQRIDSNRLGVACRIGDGEVNNDFVLVHHGLKVGGIPHDLYGIFDGVSGFEIDSIFSHFPFSHEISRQAAQSIVETLGSGRLKDPAEAVVTALETSNREVCGSPLYSGKGFTTATVVLIDPEKRTGFVGQVGDSRAYSVQKSNLYRLTTDQVWYSTPPEGRRVRHLKPMLGSPDMKYDIREIELAKGGLLLLTTDGVHDVLQPEAMRQTISNESLKGNLCFAAHDLFYKAQHLAKFAGGRVDDASAVVARI